MIQPPLWSQEELHAARDKAQEHFRSVRYTEPLELYTELFDEYQGVVEEVMEETVDLTQFDDHTANIWANNKKREVFRYLTGPPVSLDDLKILLEAKSLAPTRVRANPELQALLVSFLRDLHDRRRFPWLGEGWEPTEHDRRAAVLATTALLAMRRLQANRRNLEQKAQEQRVAEQLVSGSFKQVKARRVRTLNDAPKAGEFCRECYLGTRKADFLIGLWDGRSLALECKVSNSSTNSVKRLNNDAAVKAETWRKDFGQAGVVPAAVLSGVYKLHNLIDAQQRGLSLFWAHDLPSMVGWINRTSEH